MHDIIKYWPFVSLAANFKKDRDLKNNDPSDYIKTVLREWLPEYSHFEQFHLGKLDYSYVVETEDFILLVHLGTQGGLFGPGWMSNIFGYFYTSHGMQGEYYKAGKKTYDAMEYWIAKAQKFNKTVVQVCHSRGTGRGKALAKLAVDHEYPKPLTLCYCPMPAHTKKGTKQYREAGLGECTYSVIMNGDWVDNAGMFRFHHVGMKIKLPDVEWLVQDLPTGGHAYSSVTQGLKKWIEDKKYYDEALRYLESKSFVDTI